MRTHPIDIASNSVFIALDDQIDAGVVFFLTFQRGQGPNRAYHNGEIEMTKFSVPDMTCGHCKAAVEAALKGLDANASVDVDLETHVVSVNASGAVPPMIAALKEAGYSATEIA